MEAAAVALEPAAPDSQVPGRVFAVAGADEPDCAAGEAVVVGGAVADELAVLHDEIAIALRPVDAVAVAVLEPQAL